MAGDDETSANIESLSVALSEAEIKAASGDQMYLVRANFLREKLASLTTLNLSLPPFHKPYEWRLSTQPTPKQKQNQKKKVHKKI
jgi:hypothetical protein